MIVLKNLEKVIEMNNSYDLEIANEFNLIDFIPMNTILHLDHCEVRLISKYTVALGGYATVEVAEFNKNGKRLHYGVEICNNTFGLVKLLNDCINQPFLALSEEMKSFVINFHSAAIAKQGYINTMDNDG